MPNFYSIQDSILESIEQDAERITINLRAIRTESPDGSAAASHILRQEIRLVLDGAAMEVDSSNLPSWLLKGSFHCAASDADPADGAIEKTIPVSLRTASGVELVLSGLHEGGGEYITIGVHARTLALEPLAAPEPLRQTRASI